MARIEQKVTIQAPPSVVWAILTDVERWPEWTASAQKIVVEGAAPLANGSRARVKMNGPAATTWQVTRLDAERTFTWETRPMPAFGLIGEHVLLPLGDATEVTLAITTDGALATLSSPLIAWISRRNMKLEAEGLKRRAESQAAANAQK